MSEAIGIAAELIKRFEGCSLVSYCCPAGVWTIGYGHTGADVKEGKKITGHEADQILMRDVAHACANVTCLVKAELNNNELAALTSFVFNVGAAAFTRSTMLKLLNAGKPRLSVSAEFNKWVFAKGRELPGLGLRRDAERKLFLS